MKIMAVFRITVKIYGGKREGSREKIYDRRDTLESRITSFTIKEIFS